MNSGFNQNQPELGIFVFAVALKVLANGHSLVRRVNGQCLLIIATIVSTHLFDQHV